MGRKPSKKPTKADAITVRLSPRTRFGLELAARRQRRTISAIVEEFVEKGLKRDSTWSDGEETEDLLQQIWDPDECERFINLASYKPHLLDYQEELMWKSIKECPAFWVKDPIEKVLKKLWDSKAPIRMETIREHWELIKEIGTGEKSLSELPKE